MEPFSTLTAVAAPMPAPNIDTDQIIPARFLRKPRSAGYENWLFHDLRYRQDGSENPDFVLNQVPYRDARIIVADVNFGCGSSREGAVWALKGHGIRALVASSFGDILFNNALKNGILPIVLKHGDAATIIAQLERRPGATLAIDLPAQTLTGADGTVYAFDIDAFRKECLLKGQDDIGITTTFLAEIAAFEQRVADTHSFLEPSRGGAT